jgi:hypothetical protein
VSRGGAEGAKVADRPAQKGGSAGKKNGTAAQKGGSRKKAAVGTAAASDEGREGEGTAAADTDRIRQEPEAMERDESRQSVPAIAPPELGAVVSTEAEQWSQLNNQLDLLAIAPEDEILAEILSLQTELAQVCAKDWLVPCHCQHSCWATAACAASSMTVDTAPPGSDGPRLSVSLCNPYAGKV